MRPEILPDCRPVRPTGGKSFLGQMWYRVSCANCRAEGPYVPEQNMTFAFYLCNPCFESHGAIAGTMVLPDEAVSLDRLESIPERTR